MRHASDLDRFPVATSGTHLGHWAERFNAEGKRLGELIDSGDRSDAIPAELQRRGNILRRKGVGILGRMRKALRDVGDSHLVSRVFGRFDELANRRDDDDD